jgi:hypothetical protein
VSQPTQDLKVGLALAPGAVVTPFCRASEPIGAAVSGYPLDDDPLFPYLPTRMHASGFQFDLVSCRPLAVGYAAGVLDELGHPLLDEYGAPIL